MWDVPPLLIAGALIILWCVGLYLLQRRGLLEPRGLSPSPPPAGPFLMWKTVRGRNLIERLARPARFWRIFGDLAILLVALTMAGTTILLIWEATLVQSAAVRGNPPSPDLLLGLPGINPIIPLGYGILGLSVAVILHEFSHGILSRVAKIRIRSLGLIFLIFPIGAFVEPDEDELRALPRHDRARLYAAGPATNILLAILFAVLFSSVMMASVTPVHEGVGIVGFTEGGSPSQAAGIQAYTVIIAINGTPIHSYAEFRNLMAGATAGTNVTVTTFNPADSTTQTVPVRLAAEPGTGRPLLGIYAIDVSTDYYHPLTNPDRFGGVPGAILAYISLPFQGRAPIQDPAARFYQVSGPLAALPLAVFWLIANSLYWLFWLNTMLGATNALPAVPLDGGYIFKDGIEGLVSRLKKGLPAERRDRIVRSVSYSFALLILGLVLWQLIGPRI
ncbi:MAG TPA: site-2 protease family protein [Thermoplasmata archaeon]|nr:site-2 protease family protein [Thermoplasmata archaeon]